MDERSGAWPNAIKSTENQDVQRTTNNREEAARAREQFSTAGMRCAKTSDPFHYLHFNGTANMSGHNKNITNPSQSRAEQPSAVERAGGVSKVGNPFRTIELACVMCLTFSLSAQESEYRPCTPNELQNLYSALTRTTPATTRVLVFNTIKIPPLTDDEILQSAHQEQQALRNEFGKQKSVHQTEEELRHIVERKSINSDVVYFLEREIATKDAYRLDGTHYTVKKLPAVPTNLLAFAALETNRFETTIILDRTKGEHYNCRINWRLGSSSYSDRPGSAPLPRAHYEAGKPSPALQLILLPLLIATNQNRLLFDKAILQSLMIYSNAPYELVSRPIGFDGNMAQHFRVQKTGKSDSVLAEFALDPSNYNRMFQLDLYDTQGKLIEQQEKRDFDVNDFPHFWKVKRMAHSKWVNETREFLEVQYPKSTTRESFEIKPPESFSIENHSSGQVIIERYPMVGKRRLGPSDVVWDDGAQHSSKPSVHKKVVLFCLFALSTGLPIYWLFRERRMKTKKEGK